MLSIAGMRTSIKTRSGRSDCGKAETYIALTLIAGVFAVYLMPLLRSSKPQRRSLIAVAVTSLLFLPAWFAANFSAWILKLDLDTLETMAWVIDSTPRADLQALLMPEEGLEPRHADYDSAALWLYSPVEGAEGQKGGRIRAPEAGTGETQRRSIETRSERSDEYEHPCQALPRGK